MLGSLHLGGEKKNPYGEKSFLFHSKNSFHFKYVEILPMVTMQK